MSEGIYNAKAISIYNKHGKEAAWEYMQKEIPKEYLKQVILTMKIYTKND